MGVEGVGLGRDHKGSQRLRPTRRYVLLCYPVSDRQHPHPEERDSERWHQRRPRVCQTCAACEWQCYSSHGDPLPADHSVYFEYSGGDGGASIHQEKYCPARQRPPHSSLLRVAAAAAA